MFKKMSLALKFNKNRSKPGSGINIDKNDVYKRHVTTVEKTLKNIETYLEENKLPNYDIDSVLFSVIEKDMLNKISVCNVKNPNSNLDPSFSLEDPRMGTIENYQLCSTCEKTNDECPGHLGMMELGANFIHPFYRNIVIQVLKCICHKCNNLLISDNIILERGINNLKGNEKLRAIASISSTIECNNPTCSLKPHFKTQKASSNSIRIVPYTIKKGKIEEDKFMSVDNIKKRLTYISSKDAKTLGFVHNHPRNFIIDFIPVIPLNDRPYNIKNMDKSDHPLTFAYKDILNKNIESLQYDELDKREECYNRILEIYEFLIKNSKGEYKRSQNDPVKSITDLITHKEGLIRGHLMGKRCDFTGRSPLGPNEKLNFGYLAPPEEMKKLSIPENVTIYNYDSIIKLAEEGKIKFLCPKKGNLAGRKLKFDLSKHKNYITIGDRVDRMSENGDVFIFNRQPTLHRQGMLSYVADFQDKFSIGVHLSSTKGLNADFDGDEGNLHLVQTSEAQVETRLIMSAINCIISSSTSAPIASLVYNSLTGAYLLTDNSVLFTKEEFNKGYQYVNSRMKTDYVETNKKELMKKLGDKDYYTGQELCSIIFPPDFWWKIDTDGRSMFVCNGILKTKLYKAKTALGTTQNGIIQSLVKRYNKNIASYFITAGEFLFNWYIYYIGFSLGIDNIMMTKEQQHEFFKYRSEKLEKLDKELRELPDITNNSTVVDIEETDNSMSTNIRNTDTDIAKNLANNVLNKENNSISVMYKSGAKGDDATAIKIIGSLGQTYVGNQLPKKTLSDKRRWLSTFSIYDKRAVSRGHCVNSYFHGLDVDEYFSQTQSGRLTIIDTAIRTADIGYLQRKMVKAQEDLIMNYDGSVRNQTGIVFQFSYGAGFASTEMVIDDSEKGFPVFSFINLKELCGVTNYENGFENFDLEDTLRGYMQEINNKYNFVEEKELFSPNYEELEDYVDLGFDNDFIDFEFDT